jgi:hypothetical protein
VSSFCLLSIRLSVGAPDSGIFCEVILDSRSRSDPSLPDSASSVCVETRRSSIGPVVMVLHRLFRLTFIHFYGEPHDRHRYAAQSPAYRAQTTLRSMPTAIKPWRKRQNARVPLIRSNGRCLHHTCSARSRKEPKPAWEAGILPLNLLPSRRARVANSVRAEPLFLILLISRAYRPQGSARVGCFSSARMVGSTEFAPTGA